MENKNIDIGLKVDFSLACNAYSKNPRRIVSLVSVIFIGPTAATICYNF